MMEAVNLPEKPLPTGLVSSTVCACPQCTISPSRNTPHPNQPSHHRAKKKKVSRQSPYGVVRDTNRLSTSGANIVKRPLSSGGYAIGREQNIRSPYHLLHSSASHTSLLGKPRKELAEIRCFSITYARKRGRGGKNE